MDEKFMMEYRKDHDPDNYTILGEIELFDIHDTKIEKVLGSINLKKKAKYVIVELYLREDWENPHIHLYNEETGFRCAIRLDTNSYFIHGKYQDKLNDKQAKIFDEFMREKYELVPSRWIYAVSTFNSEFSDHKIKTTKQPDYTRLNH